MARPMDIRPRVGMEFEHAFLLDRNWKPDVAKGEKYKDAPHEICRVTKLTPWAVYYRQVGAERGSSYVARDKFATVVGKILDKEVELTVQLTTEQVLLVETLARHHLARLAASEQWRDSPVERLTQDLVDRIGVLPH